MDNGLLTFGIGGIGQMANYAATTETNQANIDYAKYASQQQRDWALQDWNRTNQYNSPVEQMNRLRQAGLNPNLVYGKGADNTASMVRTTDVKTPDLRAPQIDTSALDIGHYISEFQNIKRQQIETDNLDIIRNNMVKAGINKDADTLLKLTNADRKGQENDWYNLSKGLNYDSLYLGNLLKNEEIKNKAADTFVKQANRDFTINQQQINNIKSRMDTHKAWEEIYTQQLRRKQMALEMEKIPAQKSILELQVNRMNQLIKTGEFQQKITAFEATLAENGIGKNDPMYIRYMTKLISELEKLDNLQK